MTAVSALHGLPDGQLVAVRVHAESDYACGRKDGNRYRIDSSEAGRVVVDQQK
jgi:hypothetical protein